MVTIPVPIDVTVDVNLWISDSTSMVRCTPTTVLSPSLILELVIMLYSVSQTVAVVVDLGMVASGVNGSFLEDLVLLSGKLPQLLTSVEVEDPVQLS